MTFYSLSGHRHDQLGNSTAADLPRAVCDTTSCGGLIGVVVRCGWSPVRVGGPTQPNPTRRRLGKQARAGAGFHPPRFYYAAPGVGLAAIRQA